MEGAAASSVVSGVRITPRELRFLDAVPGERYRATLRVQNLQQHSVFLYFLPPQKPQVGKNRSSAESSWGRSAFGKVPLLLTENFTLFSRGRGLIGWDSPWEAGPET